MLKGEVLAALDSRGRYQASCTSSIDLRLFFNDTGGAVRRVQCFFSVGKERVFRALQSKASSKLFHGAYLRFVGHGSGSVYLEGACIPEIAPAREGSALRICHLAQLPELNICD